LDFYCEEDASLPQFTLKDFMSHIFSHCPLLLPYASKIDEIIKNWVDYKIKVPVYGGILLNPAMDKVLMVKGCGARPSWGFPKGKINKDEPEIDCAVREVYEEIGYDLTGKIQKDDFLESVAKEQRVKLYIVAGISEDTVFETQTRKEISEIAWHNLKDIPHAQGVKSTSHYNGSSYNNYFLAFPFMAKLRKWINNKKQKKTVTRLHTDTDNTTNKNNRNKSANNNNNDPNSTSPGGLVLQTQKTKEQNSDLEEFSPLAHRKAQPLNRQADPQVKMNLNSLFQAAAEQTEGFLPKPETTTTTTSTTSREQDAPSINSLLMPPALLLPGIDFSSPSTVVQKGPGAKDSQLFGPPLSQASRALTTTTSTTSTTATGKTNATTPSTPPKSIQKRGGAAAPQPQQQEQDRRNFTRTSSTKVFAEPSHPFCTFKLDTSSLLVLPPP